uniref:Uncharacterized protein LOC111127560 n=1 Tax=Crassostrea virginica TaxID=6565 RepID=A0A8B8DL41_CRAVI|nr:uncharacterized protein LOC111127560 [Crassostrea virginica]
MARQLLPVLLIFLFLVIQGNSQQLSGITLNPSVLNDPVRNILLTEYINNLCLTSGEDVYLYEGLERIKLCDRGEDKRKRLLLLLLIPLLCLPLYSNTSIVTLVIDNVIPGPSPDPGPNPGPNPPPTPT